MGPWRPLDPPMQKGSKLQMYLVYSSCGLLRLGPSLENPGCVTVPHIITSEEDREY